METLIPGTDMLDCGHMESPHHASTRGYGTDKDGKRHCYECCHRMDLEALKRERKYGAYLGRDARGHWAVSSWPGRVLMYVYANRVWTTSAGGFARDTKITRFYARDQFGQWWIGQGPGEGMYTRLTKLKHAPK